MSSGRRGVAWCDAVWQGDRRWVVFQAKNSGTDAVRIKPGRRQRNFPLRRCGWHIPIYTVSVRRVNPHSTILFYHHKAPTPWSREGKKMEDTSHPDRNPPRHPPRDIHSANQSNATWDQIIPQTKPVIHGGAQGGHEYLYRHAQAVSSPHFFRSRSTTKTKNAVPFYPAIHRRHRCDSPHLPPEASS